MYNIDFSDRFTYLKTYRFWNVLDSIKSMYQKDSLDFFIINRDKIIFQLSYSYGLRPLEIISLKRNDLNFDNKNDSNEAFGSIYVSSTKNNSFNNTNQSRLVYPIFKAVTEDIYKYLDLYDLMYLTHKNSSLFHSSKGNLFNLHYLNSRLQYYNSKLDSNYRIESLYFFRQYYIADLFRIEGIAQSFINLQIGNNTTNNQIYNHLKP